MLSIISLGWILILIILLISKILFNLYPTSKFLRFCLLHGSRTDSGIVKKYDQLFMHFIWFYIIGAFNMFLVIFTLLVLRDYPYMYNKVLIQFTQNKNSFPVLISCFLLFFHIIIRFYECLFVFHFGSYISIIHLLWGCLYYILVSWTLFFICPKIPNKWRSIDKLNLYHFIWISYYLFCCLLQNQLHRILARSKGFDGNYKRIKIGLFRYISCPHYLIEATSYLCLAMIIWDSLEMWIIFIFTLISLMISSSSTHQLYMYRFRNNHPSYAIIPFIF